MVLTYQVERWSDALPEMQELWPLHWAEVGMDKSAVPLDPDLDAYAKLESKNALHVTTARDGGKLVGYQIWLVSTHLHYRTTLCGFNDMYFLHPAYRKGWAGVRLFRESEAQLKRLGVKKLYNITKRSLDVSAIFKRLGWTEASRTFTKYIG